MSSWRAVGFDLDDTLFDHTGAATAAVRDFTESLGFEATPERVTTWFELESEHFERWRAGRISFAQQRRLRLRGYLRSLGTDASIADDDVDAHFEKYLVAYRRAWRPFPGTASFLTSLRDRGIRIGVLTNGSREQQIDKLETTGLMPLVDVVCVSEEIGFAKPDPRAFVALVTRLGMSPSETAFLGDRSDMDVAGARAAGLAAARVAHRGTQTVTLEAALGEATLGTR